MCELLGISFNIPIRPNLSVRGFRKKGEKNPDGWGIGYYPDESAQVIKEPIEAGKSLLSFVVRNYTQIISRIFITHVRKASIGKISHKNTHPFCRELEGKEYIFAHNGSLERYKNLKTGRFIPVGDTDSEHSFCHILNLIDKRNIESWTSDDFLWMNQQLWEINKMGKFNCMFSDGEYLFCYNDVNDFKDYCHVHRKGPYNKIKLLDEDFEIDLANEKDPSQTGYLIATNPLTDENWESYLPGELVVYKNGDIVFSNSFVK